MTDKEKKQVETYRKNGYGYKRISNLTNLSVNTIKSYCKRNKLMSSDISNIIQKIKFFIVSNAEKLLSKANTANTRDSVQIPAETNGGTIILIWYKGKPSMY